MKYITVNVRLCERKSDQRFWYEENNSSGWKKVEGTECACPENAFFRLQKELEARLTQEQIPIYHPPRMVTVAID
jgi:hypothetical protein